MKLKFKYHPMGLTAPYNDSEITVKDGGYVVVDEAKGKALLRDYPYNFFDAVKMKAELEEMESTIKRAPDKMVREGKPKTRRKQK